MFRNIVQAPMRFFYMNQTGRILNRFSKDMGIIDERMPRTLFSAIEYLTDLGGIIVIILIANPAMIVAFLAALVLFSSITKLYARPSQDLRRLEGICKL